MTAIRIAYHTTDEVNLDSATQTAQEYGASLAGLADPDVRPGGSLAALLCDLDRVDSRRGQAIVNELRSRPAPFPVAVHGYDLGDEDMTVLHANGVIASRQFDPEVVRALCRASESSHRVVPDPEGRDSEGISDDPAVLCGMVRSLATHTYRVLHRTSAGTPDGLTPEIGELRGRIDQLQRQIERFRRQHDLRLEDLQRWLDSLRRRVECLLAQPSSGAEE
jgi:hypothetical protein